jgi:hypothetical protein
VQRTMLNVEAPCSKLQGILDPQGSTIYSNRSLIWLTVVKSKIVPGSPFFSGFVFLYLLQGTSRDGACFATFDHSDIRGFDRMT